MQSVFEEHLLNDPHVREATQELSRDDQQFEDLSHQEAPPVVTGDEEVVEPDWGEPAAEDEAMPHVTPLPEGLWRFSSYQGWHEDHLGRPVRVDWDAEVVRGSKGRRWPDSVYPIPFHVGSRRGALAPVGG